MYTLKGIFPEPAKSHKRNFIKENMKQLKCAQSKTAKEPKFTLKNVPPSRLSNPLPKGNARGPEKSSPQSKSGKLTLNVGKTSSTSTHKKKGDIPIKKGDMAEFLKRKELRQCKTSESLVEEEEEVKSESSDQFRDIGCQTIESNISQKLSECTKLTMLYPKKDEDSEAKLKASGDSGRHNMVSPLRRTPCRSGDEPNRDPHELLESERQRSKLNSILEKKDNKDPYLPSGYQKGVLPKYLRERKEQGLKEAEGALSNDSDALCPPGHVTLPDVERKETLRMLRNSFAELVSELNKLPVKTDTLRMRNRKMELEKQLAKLEEGIKVFSRPKVFVKMGE